MANISALLEIIHTAHLGRDMRQALHDAIETVNNDTENALGKSLTFVTATRKLSLKAKDGSTLSEVTIPGGSGSGSVNSVNNVQPDADGNVTVNLANINDVNLNSPSSGQVLKYDGEKWINGSGGGGGGGTSDYTDLTNKPQINGVTLSGNKTSDDLGLASADDVNSKANKSDITSIVATGTTNNTGNTITNGSLFYLNDTLCKALSNIASGSAFTLNTNYKERNLNEEITANNGGTRVNWSAGNAHTVPNDGYIHVYGTSSGTNGYVSIKGANDSLLCQLTVNGEYSNGVFVRSGMIVQTTTNSGSITTIFAPIY